MRIVLTASAYRACAMGVMISAELVSVTHLSFRLLDLVPSPDARQGFLSFRFPWPSLSTLVRILCTGTLALFGLYPWRTTCRPEESSDILGLPLDSIKD